LSRLSIGSPMPMKHAVADRRGGGRRPGGGEVQRLIDDLPRSQVAGEAQSGRSRRTYRSAGSLIARTTQDRAAARRGSASGPPPAGRPVSGGEQRLDRSVARAPRLVAEGQARKTAGSLVEPASRAASRARSGPSPHTPPASAPPAHAPNTWRAREEAGLAVRGERLLEQGTGPSVFGPPAACFGVLSGALPVDGARAVLGRVYGCSRWDSLPEPR